MNERRRPRRPAMLDPRDAEQIQGDEDPADSAEVAHRSAAIIVGKQDPNRTVEPDITQRLIAVVNTQGVDTVAELWSRSPADTLPGVLWRLYLIHEWYRRDPDTVEKRYEEGLAAPKMPGINVDKVDLVEVMDKLSQLLLSRYEGNLDELLIVTGKLIRILAAGATFGSNWIEDDSSELADEVTRRARALLATAEELELAAKHITEQEWTRSG